MALVDKWNIVSIMDSIPSQVSMLYDWVLIRKQKSLFFHVCWHFWKLFFSKNSFRNTIRVSNGLDSEQDRHVGPNLSPNCLQRISAED